jgi:ABC-type antimicrobial peptide transport system permease subunit
MKGALARHHQLSTTWILFGASALLLTAIGLYGLMSYTVSRRVNEIRIRMALGATGSSVMTLMMQQVLTLVLVGLVTGSALSLGLNQALQSFVFGVELFDPWTLAGVAAIVSGVTGLAIYLPARKASRVDPVTALRCD